MNVSWANTIIFCYFFVKEKQLNIRESDNELKLTVYNHATVWAYLYIYT